MKGIIAIYINFPEAVLAEQNVQATIDLLIASNRTVIDRIKKENDYEIMVVPTREEACRIEKIDFSLPFPRFSPKSHNYLGDTLDEGDLC